MTNLCHIFPFNLAPQNKPGNLSRIHFSTQESKTDDPSSKYNRRRRRGPLARSSLCFHCRSGAFLKSFVYSPLVRFKHQPILHEQPLCQKRRPWQYSHTEHTASRWRVPRFATPNRPTASRLPQHEVSLESRPVLTLVSPDVQSRQVQAGR